MGRPVALAMAETDHIYHHELPRLRERARYSSDRDLYTRVGASSDPTLKLQPTKRRISLTHVTDGDGFVHDDARYGETVRRVVMRDLAQARQEYGQETGCAARRTRSTLAESISQPVI